MEDAKNGRRPKWKMTQIDDGPNGRRQKLQRQDNNSKCLKQEMQPQVWPSSAPPCLSALSGKFP